MSAQVYSAPCQTEGRRKTFLEWTSIDLSSTCGGNVNYYKSVHHPIPTLLFSEQISKLSPVNYVCRYIFFMASLKRRGRPKRGLHWAHWDYPQEHMVVMKDEKVCPFVKFDIILPLFCCLLYPLINEHCRTWSSLINLWIYSRNFQKYRILLSARRRYNNYLKLSKESVMGNMMLSHWPCFTWKFFMIWFHKILKLL